MSSIIEARGLTKRYGRTVAVDNIDLDIAPGRKPRFAHNFMAATGTIDAAIKAYVQAVKSGDYPAPEHCFAE